ncbi:MAG: 30S ribosome-binding factor RbfA [Pseudomonadota bacterium]
MAREFSRQARLGGQVHRVLNELLRFESKDPRLEGVSVSSVELSGDLSVAKVYFSTLSPDADPAPVLEGLKAAGGFLRSRLGREIRSRRVPELRFAHDDSVARGFHLSGLIADTAAPEPGDDDGED